MITENEELMRTVEALYEYVDKRVSEISARGAPTSATEEALDRINDRLDKLEARYQKPQLPMPVSADTGVVSAYKAWLRSGRIPGDAEPSVVKTLTSSSDPAGGYLLVPPEEERELLRNVVETSPIRTIARVRATSAKSVKVRRRSGVFSAQWVAERGTKSETTGLAYAQEEVPTHEVYALVDVTNEDLEDSAFNLDAEIRNEAAEQIGVAENAAFVGGSGVGRPEGITANSDVQVLNSGAAGDFDADDLIDLMTALKEPYWRESVWLLNRLTLRKVRKLKTTSGDYVWAPAAGGVTTTQSVAGFVPSTILDRPYVLCTDVAATGTSGAKSVIVGNFRQGYLIVDRLGIEVLRDPYTQSASGVVRFTFRKRVGGQVVLPEAIKILQESA